jgi:hypothetical protein
MSAQVRKHFSMLIRGKDFRPNRSWLIAVVATTVAAVAWYAAVAMLQGSLPGGSSRPGLVFGVVAGAIIVFEFLLWPRKKVRAWRIGSAQSWLRAHIWLGLLSLPLALLHARLLFFGGWLNISLMVVFLIVIASGVYGLILQQFLPHWLLERVPAETIYAQIDHVAKQQCEDAEELVLATCGSTYGEEDHATVAEVQGFGVVTGFRSMTGIQGKVLETQPIINVIAGAEMVREEFFRAIKPYLLDGRRSTSGLKASFDAQRFFQTLREQSPLPAHELVDRLEQLCSQRRQFDLQERLHHWLHAWLWVHLPLSVALLVMLSVHVFVALRYW